MYDRVMKSKATLAAQGQAAQMVEGMDENIAAINKREGRRGEEELGIEDGAKDQLQQLLVKRNQLLTENVQLRSANRGAKSDSEVREELGEKFGAIADGELEEATKIAHYTQGIHDLAWRRKMAHVLTECLLPAAPGTAALTRASDEELSLYVTTLVDKGWRCRQKLDVAQAEAERLGTVFGQTSSQATDSAKALTTAQQERTKDNLGIFEIMMDIESSWHTTLTRIQDLLGGRENKRALKEWVEEAQRVQLLENVMGMKRQNTDGGVLDALG